MMNPGMRRTLLLLLFLTVGMALTAVVLGLSDSAVEAFF
jgi:hypothetical protein